MNTIRDNYKEICNALNALPNMVEGLAAQMAAQTEDYTVDTIANEIRTYTRIFKLHGEGKDYQFTYYPIDIAILELVQAVQESSKEAKV